MSVPQRIRWVRKQAGSHDKLAAKLGTSRSLVIRWEQGTHKPSKASRARLAKVTGLPAGFFRESVNGSDVDEEDALVEALVGNIRALVRAELAKRDA